MCCALKMTLSLSCLSLILLFIGADSMPLEKPSDTAQQPAAWCGDPRPKSSLASPCNDEDKVRRFFLHETNPKGCKQFSICPNEATKYDLLTENNYFLSFKDCQRSCMQHIDLCPELPVGPNMTVVSDNGLQGWGRRVVFECNRGYSLSDNTGRRVRTCQKNGTWTRDAPVCLKQCERPSTVRHANIAPSKALHSQGGTVHYTCEVGYELIGSAQRTCGQNGEWIEQEPTCRCQGQASDTGECTTCPELSPIEHGDLHAPNRSLFAQIQYMCKSGYTMVGSPTRVCGENGQWSGKEPICWNLSINMQIGNEEANDVTNQVVELEMGTKNIVFTAISSTPNPFKDITPVWTFNEGPLILPFIVIPDESGYKLTFNSILMTADREQVGNYSIELGNYTTGFQLHVLEATVDDDVITERPQRVVLNNMTTHSNTAELLCIVSGIPVPTIEWYHNDELLTNNERIHITEHGEQTAISILSITDLRKNDSGVYVCRAENAAGNDSWLTELNIASTVQKRSIQDDAMPSSLCDSESSDTVTLLGRVKAQVRQTPSSDSLPSYRVQVKRFVRGSDAESSTRRVRVVVADELLAGDEERLRTNTDYIFQGRLIDKTLFVSRHNVLRHNPELESSTVSRC